LIKTLITFYLTLSFTHVSTHVPVLLLNPLSDLFIKEARIFGLTVIKLNANDPKWQVNMDVEVYNAGVI